MKQVIIVRQDLKLPKGKMSAQVAHASVDAVLKSKKDIVEEWKSEGMKKVVLKVENKEELLEYFEKAKKAKLTNALIKDAAKTFLKQPEITCLAIGPEEDEKVDKITGKLKMV